MVNTYRYSQFNKNDIMNYYIVESEEEYEFINSYRARLKSVVVNALRSVSFCNLEYKEASINDLMLLIEDIKNYMKEAKPSTIMSKVRFINNVSKELFALKFELENYDGWSFRDNEPDRLLKAVEVFIKAVASEELNKDNLFDKCKSHLDKEMSLGLVKDLKNNFLNFINKENPKDFDIYFFMGDSLTKEERKRKEIKDIQEKNCGGCNVDDCVLSHCSHFFKMEELESEAKTYKLSAGQNTIPQDMF